MKVESLFYELRNLIIAGAGDYDVVFSDGAKVSGFLYSTGKKTVELEREEGSSSIYSYFKNMAPEERQKVYEMMEAELGDDWR